MDANAISETIEAVKNGDKNAFRQFLVDECALDKLPEELTIIELENLIVKAKTHL